MNQPLFGGFLHLCPKMTGARVGRWDEREGFARSLDETEASISAC